jgi:O-6-methylguanine DNA methyltransferase
VAHHQPEVAVPTYRYDLFSTPRGWMAILASQRGVRRISLRPTPDQAIADMGRDLDRAVQDPKALAPLKERMLAFLAGEADSLDDVALDMADAPSFFRAAWEACRTIPVGETRSYAWLAAAAGRPGAFRAAGQAMARNRFSLIVPCHRVIGSDGGLHGYGGGLDVKARLLEEEGVHKRP